MVEPELVSELSADDRDEDELREESMTAFRFECPNKRKS